MVNKKGKGAKTKGSKPPVKKHQQETSKDLTQQSPQERVALVRPLWETLEQDERVKLLSIDLGCVRARAKQLAEAARQQAVADAPEGEPLDPALLELEPSIEDVLEEGIKRLKEKGTWKLWQWPADNSALYDAESFRQHITDKHIREELRRLLPRDEGRATEKPAEAAFRQRMLDLLAKVQQSTSANSLRPTVVGASGEDGAARPYRRRGDPGSHLRDANIELLAVLLEALAKENDHLYHSLLTPITSYVMEILPEGHRETTKLELSFEDLENLLPDDVSRIVEWLTEKVDALSTKLKPEPKEDEEEEEENMGDVDLWALTEDDSSLTVNSKWLQHLQQDRLLGEDGHPRRAKPGEDPGHNGLVLEWVYGSIVSTAEKARDGSKRCLGMQPPTAGDAHMVLVRALEEHLSWETRAKQCKDLLSEMLKSRLEAAELTKQGYDLRPQPKRDLPGVGGSEASTSPLLLDDGGAAPLGAGAAGDSKPLPDDVILFMLRREALLTRAKLHFLVFEHLTQEKELRILKQALRQGEPEFERLKRELDEVKHQPRGMDGAYRSAAEMERHRHQLEVQTAFREQGARLQATYDKKQKAEYDMAKRETEIKQLQGWKGTVENLVDKFQELINSRNERLQAAGAGAESTGAKEAQEAEGDLEAASGSLTPQQYIQLTKMRNHFAKDVRKQLYSDADDRTFFDNLKSALKAIERRLEDSSVALQHLEMQLINVACDDPGAIIGTQLALPLLQDRLDQRGLEYAAQRAKLAEDEVLRMELLAAEREAAERERKKAAKAKKNEKVKSEKERLAAERQAKEEAERAARQEAERERAIRDEEERRKRIEAVEAMRKAEEAAMELRRKELLSDENGYWRQRMMMEERLSGMGMGSMGAGNTTRSANAAATASPDVTEEADRNGSPSPEDGHCAAEDDEGFITESRRRRHKDTRDQDEEVASSSAAPAGDGGRGPQVRSGSRDRMGPRDGVQQRERGEHHHRDRDREPRRHQASSSAAAGHRSGSREAGGRQAQGSGAGQQAQRPPSAPPAATAAATGPPATTAPAQQSSTSATVPAPAAAPVPAPAEQPAVAAATPAPAEPAEPVASSVSEPAAAPSTTTPSAEGSEVPAAPASVSPETSSAATRDADAAAAGTTVVALPAAAVPEDAILFGDIAVIPTATVTAAPPVTAAPKSAQPLPIPRPIPVVMPPPGAAAPPDSQQAAAFSQPEQQQRQQPPAGKAGIPKPVAGPAPSQQPQPQQPLAGPSGGAPVPQAPQHGQGTIGPHVHAMGPMPADAMPGPLPTMVPGGPPPMMAHIAQVPAPRPPGPAPGPHPPYMHVNGAIPVPLPAPGGPIVPMPPGLPKQMQGQPMPGPPPPPQGAMMMPMGGPPGARPPMPGPGMPPGPPPGMAVPSPPQPQPGGVVRPSGPMGQQGPMPGMPGPQGPQGGIVPVPHPQGPGQPPHGQAPVGPPPGAAPRGAAGSQGQHMMMAPMQFAPPMHGGAMGIPHGQPPSGPMGHVPPGMYVFPPGGPGMLPPGAPAQLPPHPHMLHVMPGGVALPMAVPPPLHMQPPPLQQQGQQQPQQQAQGSQGPPAPSPGSQPPPPPKSPSASAAASGGKMGSTLNANARSFVPSGKAAAAPPASTASSSQQPQPQGGQQSAVAGQHHAQAQRQQYQRQSSGSASDASSAAASQMPPQGPQQPGAFQRGAPTGPYGGPGQQPGQQGGQYGNRRDRREQPRGAGGPGGAGGRKGSAGAAPGGHMAVMQQAPADVASGPPAHMPPHHHAPPHPMAWVGAPMVMGHAGAMPVPIPMPHGPGMESEPPPGQGPGLNPLERSMQDMSSSGKEEGGRPLPGDATAAGPQGAIAGVPPSHPVPPPPPGAGPGPGPGPGHGPGHGMQHHMMPPHGMAPLPHGHGASRVMLVMPPGMPGPITMPMHMPVPMPMMPVHMMHPGAPAPGPTDGPVQKNGSAAESVRAPQHAQQPVNATAGAEADSEGARGGSDSAAAASASAPITKATNGDAVAAAAPGQEAPQESGGDAPQGTAGREPVASGTSGDDGGAPAADGAAMQAREPQPVLASEATAAEAAPAMQATAAQGAAPSPVAPQTAASGGQREVPPPSAAPQPQQPQHHQQHGRIAASAAAPGGASSTRTGSAGPPAPMSWSSVAAAARRDSGGTASTSGYTQDAFPSLVSAASSASSASTSASDHPLPAASSSWKAKLQQNVTQPNGQPAATGSGQKSPSQATPMANGGGGLHGSPAGVRGSSPRGTLNGSGQQLASSLSDPAIAHSNGGGGVAAPWRPSGNRPSGSALLSGPPSQLLGSLALSPAGTGPAPAGGAGVVYHPGVNGQPRQLQLVRGLQNLGGQHNCFLNVTIQSLWHLRSFRQAVLQLNVDDVAARGAAAADLTVLRALVGVFRTMAAQPPAAATPSWVVSPLELREALSVLETGQAAVRLDLSEMHDAFEVLLVLLTCMHRAEAGSGASQGQDPQLPRRVRVRDIAAGRLSGSGSKGTGAAAAGSTVHLTGAPALANGHAHHHHQPHAPASVPAAPTGYAAAVAGGAAAQQQQQQRGGSKSGGAAAGTADAVAVPSTAAHSLFGLEVQVPCTAEDDDASSAKDRQQLQQQQQPPQQQQGASRTKRDSTGGGVAATNSADGAAAAAAAGASPAPSAPLPQHPPHGAAAAGRHAGRTSAADEVEVYTKYFHLVHAQALRKALAALGGYDSGVFFEDVLCAAEAAGSSSSPLLTLPNGGPVRRSASASSAGGPSSGGLANGHGHGWVPGATAAAHPLATLLRFPSVFTIALVWESPKAPMDALRGTLEALGPRVDLALLFQCSGAGAQGSGPAAQPHSAPCELRSVICYFGHHYLVFALSEELGLWLLIDDASIQLVGHWGDVVKAMCAKRLQPSLLFYEASPQPLQGGTSPVVPAA